MKMFNKITIIGVGLIGGSIGIAVKKRKLANIVCGVGRRQSSLNTVKRIGAVDIATLNLAQGIDGADLVIIATPISLIPVFASEIAKLSIIAKKGLIVTDAGSTKSFVVSSLEKILPEKMHFIGVHPFAGSEKSGAVNSTADLFKGAKAFLTPTKNTNSSALAKVKKFWEALGSSVIIMSAKEHDRLTAQVSHMPHVAAAALMNSTLLEDAAFGSSGFCDTTRIAAGDPLMWRDICLSNSADLLKAINNLQKNLCILSKAIKDKDAKTLMREFQKAKEKREQL